MSNKMKRAKILFDHREHSALDDSSQREMQFHMAIRKTNNPVYSIQVLDRAASILDCFRLERPDLRLTEITAVTGLHKSTVYRLLEVMRRHHFVQFDEATGAYRVGIRLFELGAVAMAGCGFDKYARPALDELASATGETAHVCVLHESEIVHIAKVESSFALRIATPVGRRHPAYCTSVGKAILAHLPPEALAAYLGGTQLRPLTPKTITSPALLKAQLRRIADQGYAFDDEEVHEGVRGIAAPVRDYSGEVVAAITITGPASRITRGKLPELAAKVIQAADNMSSRLGHRPKTKRGGLDRPIPMRLIGAREEAG
jgi:DNA-binding IclR family transcriptional regulator